MKRIQKYREQPRDASGIKCYGLMKVNLTCLALTEGLWFDEHRRKHSIPDTQFPPLNTEEENVKCWCSFSSSSVGNLVLINGNMTGEVNRDILQRYLFESVKKLNVGTELGLAT